MTRVHASTDAGGLARVREALDGLDGRVVDVQLVAGDLVGDAVEILLDDDVNPEEEARIRELTVDALLVRPDASDDVRHRLDRVEAMLVELLARTSEG